MKVFPLSEIDPEKIILLLLPNGDPQLLPIGYQDGDNIIPLIIKFPMLYGNGDYSQKPPYHSLLVTCVSTDNEDHLSEMLSRIETRIFHLIRQQKEYSFLKRYKSSLKGISQTQTDRVYRFGVFKYRFTDIKVFDPKHNLIEKIYLPHLLGLPSYIESIVNLSCVWVHETTFGLYWQVKQLELRNGPLPGTELEIPGFDDEIEEIPNSYSPSE